MAVSPDSVERLVSIMKAMGYEVGPGHTRGQVDAAFTQAFEPALKALVRVGIDDETRKKLSPESKDKLYTPEIAAELRKTINETKSSEISMRALAAYADNNGFLSRSHAQLRDTLKNEKRFEGPLLVENNVNGVIAFFNNSERFMKDIDAVYPEFVNLSAAPAVATPKAQTVRATPKPKAPVEQPPAPAPAVSTSAPPPQTPPSEMPPVKTSTGGVSIVPPSELTSGATGAGYVERPAVVERDIRSISPEFPIKSFPPVMPPASSDPTLGPLKTETVYFDPFARPTPTPFAPPETHAEKKSDSSGSSTNTDKPTPGVASEIVESALVKLGAGINKHIGEAKAKSGLGMSLLLEMNEIPTLTSKPDGSFDKDSEAALQGVLKTMQRDIGLTDDEVYNYTPDVGKKIIAAIPKLKAKVEKNLSEAEKKSFDGDIKDLVSSLSVLKDSGKLTGEKLYEGPPVKLTGLGAWIIQGIFDFIGARFPKAKGLMDGLLVNLTGHSFSELMPTSPHSAELSQIRKEVERLPQQDQLKSLYLKAVEGADGKTSEQIKSVVMSGVDTLMRDSDPAQRKAFTQAVSSAFDEAEKQRATATPADAAKAFADTVKTKWDDLPAPSGSSKVSHQRPGIEIALDPKLQDLAKSLGVNPNSMVDTMDKMIALGVEQNGGREYPVLFKARDTLYVMGVTKDNVLTAMPFTPRDILGMNQAINNVQDADLKSPALELLTSARYSHVPLAEIRDRLSPERVKTFPEVERLVGREYKMWQEHVQEEALRPKIDADVEKMRKDRQAAYAGVGFNIETRSPIVSPGGAGSRVLQISDEVLGQYYALGNPVLMKDDYKGRGEVRVLFCDDHNGVRDAGGKPLKPQELYAQKHDSFKVMKITEEYDRFEGDFKKFRETLPKQMDDRTAFKRFRTHLDDQKIDLAEKYPKMASIIYNPDRKSGGQNYAYLMNHGKPDVLAMFENLHRDAKSLPRGGAYTTEDVGFFGGIGRSIKSLFNSKSEPPPDWVIDQPKVSSVDPLKPKEEGGVYEKRAKDRFPEAFKDDPPPVKVAAADPASTGPVSSDAAPGSKQRAADLFQDNAKMGEREKEFMSQEPATPAPRVPAGITP
jgi:hypothetical protein